MKNSIYYTLISTMFLVGCSNKVYDGSPYHFGGETQKKNILQLCASNKDQPDICSQSSEESFLGLLISSVIDENQKEIDFEQKTWLEYRLPEIITEDSGVLTVELLGICMSQSLQCFQSSLEFQEFSFEIDGQSTEKIIVDLPECLETITNDSCNEWCDGGMSQFRDIICL